MTGQDEEIKFWKEYLKTYKGAGDIYEEFGEFLSKHKVSGILDVGSGAVNVLGNTYNGKKYNIKYTDGLANEYQKLTDTPVEYADMCNLQYKDNSFDVVHCSNALDHSQAPLKALEEMKRVCKRFVFLRHFVNVGKIEQYKGMHQWDIDEFSGGLSIGAGAICVNFPEFYSYRRRNHEGIDFIYAIYRK